MIGRAVCSAGPDSFRPSGSTWLFLSLEDRPGYSMGGRWCLELTTSPAALFTSELCRASKQHSQQKLWIGHNHVRSRASHWFPVRYCTSSSPVRKFSVASSAEDVAHCIFNPYRQLGCDGGGGGGGGRRVVDETSGGIESESGSFGGFSSGGCCCSGGGGDSRRCSGVAVAGVPSGAPDC